MIQGASRGARPFWAATPARTVRRGHVRVPGERVERDAPAGRNGWSRRGMPA